VRQDLHALVLALLGGTLLKLALSGDYTRYVRTGLGPYLAAAGAVVIAVAVGSLISGRLRTTIHNGHDHGGGTHTHGGPDVAWLLLLPLLVVLLLAPPALGSFSAARSGTALGAASTSTLPALPTGDPVRLSELDYASRAVFDQGRSLTGRHLTLSGFLVPSGSGGWYLTRMVITCCAADAQPIKVGLTGSLPDGLAANDWLEVTGGYTARQDTDPDNGEAIPYLTVSSATTIPAPARQYES
jgi:uncharacterized repeat protein (TIGR03943 family)